LVVVLTTYYFN